ncbi:MAG: ribosome-associated translation inhibitor RaiA [Gemmatimonadetes bacterium]|nr:ribosome-associated translation inhibitor RaiA [Gemmatimonadota bacterium]
MRIQVAARHCEVPPAIRARAERQVQKMLKYEPRLASAELVFDAEAHLKRIEAVLVVPREEAIVAKADGLEFDEALDKLVRRMSRRLRRQREQRRQHQASKPFESSAVES